MLARTDGDLVSIAVEGKVSESFGVTLGEWDPDSMAGKRKCYDYLCSVIGLDTALPLDIRYQFLHRTASAIIEAQHFRARQAVMLVHSFSQTEEGFPDYERFLSLYGKSAALNRTISVGVVSGVQLHFAWVRGEEKSLGA